MIPFIEEHHNGVKTAHVIEHNRNTIDKESPYHLYRMIVSKISDQHSDVSLFLNNLSNSNFREQTITINKEEAIRLIYTLKYFLNISDEEIKAFEESLIN